MSKLTIKQENFVLAYIETGNASEAYRRAYNAEKMSDKTITEKASRLASQDKIRATLDELRADHKERHNTTIDSITVMHNEAFQLAKLKEQPAAMTTAAQNLAKLHGLIIDKQLHGEDKDNPLPTKVIIDWGD